jgi:hypothetical protein
MRLGQLQSAGQKLSGSRALFSRLQFTASLKLLPRANSQHANTSFSRETAMSVTPTATIHPNGFDFFRFCWLAWGMR